MFSLIFLTLPLSVLVVVLFAGLAFGDVAFRGVKVSQAGIAGSALQCSVPRTVSNGNRLPEPQLADSVRQVVRQWSNTPQQMVFSCDSFVPLVTEPEANIIAEELRARGREEIQRVMDRSRQHGQSCPMLTETGLCACSIARPLSCIGRCKLGGDSPEWVAGLGNAVSEAFRHHLKSKHVNSATRRLDDALVSILDRPSGSND